MAPRHAATAAFLFVAFSLPLLAQLPGPSDPLGRMHPQDPLQQQTDPNDPDRGRLMLRATLSGVVLDKGDHPLSGARVEIRNPATGMSLTSTYTRPDGSFEIENLDSHTYEIIVSSGVNEARQQIDLVPGDSNVTVHMPVLTADYSGPSTVSVAEMKVPDKARNEVRKAEGNLDKKPTEARKELTKALEIYPKYGRAHMLLGVLNLQEERVHDATSELETAIQCDPSNGMAFVMLAAAYNGQARYPDAIRALDSGTRLAPNAWQAYFEMAKAKLGLKDFAAALEHVTKAEQLCAGNFPVIHLVKANALIGISDYPRATAELEEYLRHAPPGPNSIEARRTLDEVKAFQTARK